jgi:hypothetical protein
MPAKSEKQKRFFGAVMGAKKGQSKVSGEAKKVANELPKKEIKKFLKTEDEDEQSISKQMKQTGKAIIKGPQVKERKKFAPATKVEDPKKGKGSYKRKETFDEEEQMTVPLRREPTRHEKIGSDLRKKSHRKPSIDHSKLGEVPLKRYAPPKNRIQQMDNDMKKRKTMGENTDISKFIECILTKNYVSANKYIKQAVESKIQVKIEQELSTPLF